MSDDDLESPERRLKIVVVGDGASGKTSIITKFTQVQFTREYDQTVGVDFFSRRICLPQSSGKMFLLEIWDIGGQTLGGKMLDKYLYGAEIVLFVYDISNVKSFDDIRDWIDTVLQVLPNTQCDYALVGNKADLEHLRVVSKQQHDDLARDFKMSSHIVSAKTGESVDRLFQSVAAQKLKIGKPLSVNHDSRKSSFNVHQRSSRLPSTDAKESEKSGTSQNKAHKKKGITKSFLCRIA